MTREDIKIEIMRYIDNNLTSEYVGDRIDIILRILYELKEYFDIGELYNYKFENKTIDKVIKLIQDDNNLML